MREPRCAVDLPPSTIRNAGARPSVCTPRRVRRVGHMNFGDRSHPEAHSPQVGRPDSGGNTRVIGIRGLAAACGGTGVAKATPVRFRFMLLVLAVALIYMAAARNSHETDTVTVNLEK